MPETESYAVRVRAERAQAEKIVEALLEDLFEHESVFGAFEAPDGSWFAEAHFPKMPDRAAVARIVRAIVPAGKIEYQRLAAKDWIAASLEGLHIVRAGRFAVHGAHDRARIAPNEIGIEIEAALAFGTGHHGTTLGCLSALDWIGRKHKPRRVLDAGTGTGVLAIAAARGFNVPVIATEIDRAAVEVARENVRANRVAPLVGVIHTGSLSAPLVRQYAAYDLIFANILLPVLQNLARQIDDLLAPGGHVVLSGLLSHQALAALTRYRALGLQLVRSEIADNWVTLTLRRP